MLFLDSKSSRIVKKGVVEDRRFLEFNHRKA